MITVEHSEMKFTHLYSTKISRIFINNSVDRFKSYSNVICILIPRIAFNLCSTTKHYHDI